IFGQAIGEVFRLRVRILVGKRQDRDGINGDFSFRMEISERQEKAEPGQRQRPQRGQREAWTPREETGWLDFNLICALLLNRLCPRDWRASMRADPPLVLRALRLCLPAYRSDEATAAGGQLFDGRHAVPPCA